MQEELISKKRVVFNESWSLKGFKQYVHNPIIQLSQKFPLGAEATFNAGAVDEGGNPHRAMPFDDTLGLGYSSSMFLKAPMSGFYLHHLGACSRRQAGYVPAKNIIVFAILLILFTLNSISLSAQYKLDQQVSFLYISGTSTLHDWTVVVEEMKGSLNAETDATGIKKIDSIQITIPVISLKSGKPVMDENMYKALKSDQFPEIRYELKSHIINGSELTVTGELTIAGVAKIIKSKVTCQNIGKHIKTNGELIINMSDFNIKPPEFLLGAFKTGDMVSMRFYFMFCDKL